MMTVIRTSDNAFRDFLFGQLGFLIGIVKQHIRNYLDDIFVLIKEFWTTDSPLQSTIILLVEAIAMALGSEFKVYLPQLVPHILRVLAHDSSRDKQVTHKMISALVKFGATLDDYIHLVLPPLVKLFDSAEVPWSVRKSLAFLLPPTFIFSSSTSFHLSMVTDLTKERWTPRPRCLPEHSRHIQIP